ncbi:hypothetical protein BS78_08G010600 [Paspalum vaginatum]|nr:hypothetical protein BS78_08G010600 [Paspalum vaginatum]KAJ1264579.1 hypothetical protein BS78_08G010600 [Paspalum vaginatum]KAJ1264583.1 hypothetical protein BS78_08G010600 [Paspalum vaginatum]KAJ1264584.1 hypothetical protein BS78_08G010600 [Paspalum vaginatum]
MNYQCSVMAVARNNCDSSNDFEWLLKIAPSMKDKTTQASWLMLLNAILMGVVVFIGAYAPRYRRHPVITALFNGAITLFLPIVSITVTAVDSVHDLIHSLNDKIHCYDGVHLILVFVWTGVVVVIGISATEVVAGDAREGRNVVPPIMLLVKAIWTAYLTFSTMGGGGPLLLRLLLLLMFAKLGLKYAAFYKARRSFALGRNPCRIAGYMAELQPQMLVPAAPPALIVMGETKVHDVQGEQQPHLHGFSLQRMASSQAHANRRGGLVTLDRVWGQTALDVTHKDLCFSFALFKMLRCRFAKYTVSEAGFIKASKFFRETLLLHGDDHHHERVFGIITDELSFINDYYYSSLPIYYSHPMLPALGITLSLWAIGYCLFVSVGISPAFVPSSGLFGSQIFCELTSPGCANDDLALSSLFGMGSLYYDLVPLCLVLAVLVLAETREIASYICSNWTKLALIHHRINQAWWQRPRLVQRCVSWLLRYRRCKLVRNWNDKMRQYSVLEILPGRPRICTPHLLLRRLLRLPDTQKKVEIPTDVKAAIFEAIKGEISSSSEHGDDDRAQGAWRIRPPPPPIPVSQQLLHASSSYGRRPAYTILVWHIATSVFEASQKQLQAPLHHQQQPPSSDDKIVATHLSRYCAYLVASCPELLPDDAEWCRGLYGEVKKKADRVLAELQRGYSHGDLVQALMMSAADDGSSHDQVLRNGAGLGKQLVESKTMGWEALARFWSRMVLYVAPSENLEAHAEAVSHGGELITLLWALLAHAGIVDRVDDVGADAAVDAAAEGLC